jgi:plastocyanin
MRVGATVQRVAAAVLLLPLLGGCGGGGGGPTDPDGGTPGGGTDRSASVTVSNNSFSPASTTVPVNSTVTWTWNSCSGDGYGGTTCVMHNVTFDDGGKSATQEEGSYERTFGSAGTYPYHCTLHGSPTAGMRGTVFVQ